jgi:hypothetical protein
MTPTKVLGEVLTHDMLKDAFIPKKSTFVTSNVTFEEEEKFMVCHICNAKVDANHKCKSKKTVSLGSSYILKKILKVLFVLNLFVVLLVVIEKSPFWCQKFVCRSIGSDRKKSILVPKVLVTNIEGPKKIWVPQRK